MGEYATYYHYTATRGTHVGAIIRDGYIATTESNVSLAADQPHAGPDVVWLLDGPLRDGDNHGLLYHDPTLRTLKTEIEIAVRLPVAEVRSWAKWAVEQGSDRVTRRTLMKRGGGEAQAHHWCVIERAIPRSQWVHILWRSTGKKIEIADPLGLFPAREQAK